MYEAIIISQVNKRRQIDVMCLAISEPYYKKVFNFIFASDCVCK